MDGAGCVSGAPADVKGQALVAQSTATVELFKSRQKDSTYLFNAALRDARGIMIFPDVFEAAVGVGGQGGSGVMVTRDAKGAWGYPAFYRLSGGSLGVQLGAQSREVIFLLMTDSAVRKVIEFADAIRDRRTGDVRRSRRRRVERHQHQRRGHRRLHQGLRDLRRRRTLGRLRQRAGGGQSGLLRQRFRHADGDSDRPCRHQPRRRAAQAVADRQVSGSSRRR